MKILRLSIDNFRSLSHLDLEFRGQSVFLIGENAVGKTTILEGIALALGQGGSFSSTDFGDINRPIEIQLTLSGLSGHQRAHFADEVDFSNIATLTVGWRAVWEPDEEVVDTVHGYPRRGWRKSTREQREALPVEWLSGGRDAGKILHLGRRRSLLRKIIDDLPLHQSIQDALQMVSIARQCIAESTELQDLLDNATAEIGEIIPEVTHGTFSLGVRDQTTADLISNFELYMAHYGPSVPLTRQSSGLSQLAIFAFALQLVKANDNMVLLVDEPEIALHPQAQRALLRILTELRSQCIVATHSAGLLDRADPRLVRRLWRVGAAVRSTSPASLTEDEARRLARFSDPQVAEAYFARRVILVEGASDKFALEAAASKLGLNLDGQGVAVVSLDGGAGIGTFLGLLGPTGFDLPVAGLCDRDKESRWAGTLHDGGLISERKRSDMEAIGFFVCDSDLEDELLRVAGEVRARQVIAEQGDQAIFDRYTLQPRNRGKTLIEMIHEFISSRGRKVIYGPAIVDCLRPDELPTPLRGVLNV